MDDGTMLNEVLKHLGILTDDEDVKKQITAKFKACIGYLKNAGVKKAFEKEDNEPLIECIALGVNDLLDGQPGKTDFSPAFRMFAMQLATRG